MKFMSSGKDGGKESTVWGFWLVELKRLFSVAFLHFKNGSREAYHSHAFSSVSWLLKGKLVEETVTGAVYTYKPSFLPIRTSRERFHKVTSVGDSYVFTLRGPWKATWEEFVPTGGGPLVGKYITLTNGRKEVAAR